jgi:hypothetical protein
MAIRHSSLGSHHGSQKYALDRSIEVYAHHYSMSGNLEKAYQYLKLSGDKASRNYTLWEAIR